MTETLLDQAHVAMERDSEDEKARLAYFARLAETELFLLLSREAEGDQIEPRLFELESGSFALLFDREDRLAEFAGAEVPYAAMSGRTLASLFAGQGIGLAINPEVAPSSNVLGPDAVDWLAQTIANEAQEAEANPQTFAPPGSIPEALLIALDSKLAQAAGLARHAYLAECTYDGGAVSHLLAFTGAIPGAETALVRAVNEALVFSGLEAGALDVTFLRDADPSAAAMARVGLRFDLPQPEATKLSRPAPGRDPEKPPILR
jgi:hypothetical protein